MEDGLSLRGSPFLIDVSSYFGMLLASVVFVSRIPYAIPRPFYQTFFRHIAGDEKFIIPVISSGNNGIIILYIISTVSRNLHQSKVQI